MTLRLICLCVPFFLACCGAAGADPRYGTYGRLAGQELPWREGWCGAALVDEGADFVTVGALDVTTGGPYAHLQADFLKIILHWTPLVDWRDQIPPRRWYSPYHLLLDRLGTPAGLRSRQDVLEAQLKAEEPVLEALVQAYARSQRPTCLFEVANEPNAYPYMSPELYAWYYLEWRRRIFAVAAKHGIADRVRLMPGGLWLWEVAPAPAVAVLGRFLPPEAVSATLYYQRFLLALGKQARATDQPAVPCPAVPRPPPGTPPSVDELQRRGGELVDLGNLHFYPWLYADSASRTSESPETHFRRQFQRLATLSRWVAGHCTSHQVWLTETGNLNPLSDEELAQRFMTPMLDGLERLGARTGGAGITRWHWFKAAGEDSKFQSFQDVKPYFPVLNALAWPAAMLVGVDPRDLKTTLGIVACLERQNPAQGLRYPDGRPRRIEAIYLRRSNRATAPQPR